MRPIDHILHDLEGADGPAWEDAIIAARGLLEFASKEKLNTLFNRWLLEIERRSGGDVKKIAGEFDVETLVSLLIALLQRKDLSTRQTNGVIWALGKWASRETAVALVDFIARCKAEDISKFECNLDSAIGWQYFIISIDLHLRHKLKTAVQRLMKATPQANEFGLVGLVELFEFETS